MNTLNFKHTFFQITNALVVSLIISLLLGLAINVEAIRLDPAANTYTPNESINVQVYADTTVTVDAVALRLLVNNGTITNFTIPTSIALSIGCVGTSNFNSTTVCVDYADTITDNMLLGTMTIEVGANGTTTSIDKTTGNEYQLQITATPDPAAPTIGAGTPTPTPVYVIVTTPDVANGIASYTIQAATVTELPNTDISVTENLTYIGIFLIFGGIAVSISNKLQNLSRS